MAYQGKHTGRQSVTPKKPGRGPDKAGIGKALLIITMVLLVLVILFCSAAMAVSHYLNKMDRVGADVSIVAPEDATDEIDEEEAESEAAQEAKKDAIEIEDSDITWSQVEALENDNLINILLVGQDSRVGERERSDSMIVVSINPNTAEVSLISFMRDMYVQMPDGYQDNRMNAAYAFGGFPYLYEVLEKNFGITCAGGFEVNFSGFESVIDAVGGVDIELTAAEAAYVEYGTVEGMNHLGGKAALSYARCRKLDDDFHRTSRQRAVLLALFDAVKESDLATLLNLMDTILPMMTTDMNNTQILSLVMKLAPMLQDMELETYRIPADDAYYDATIREMMVLVPDLERNRYHLQNEYLPYSD